MEFRNPTMTPEGRSQKAPKVLRFFIRNYHLPILLTFLCLFVLFLKNIEGKWVDAFDDRGDERHVGVANYSIVNEN